MAENTPQPGWSYKPGVDAANTAQKPQQANETKTPENPKQTQSNASGKGEVIWTASEFVDRHKPAGWYLLFIVALGSIAGGIYFLTKDVISSGAIAVAGVLFIVLASHKPRQLSYRVDPSGITIGAKFYPFSDFKSFALHQEGAIGSINLMPLKRFMPDLTIYYPPEQENTILNILANYLPHDQRDEHQVDRMLRKIRF